MVAKIFIFRIDLLINNLSYYLILKVSAGDGYLVANLIVYMS